jgi:hypothetical protein
VRRIKNVILQSSDYYTISDGWRARIFWETRNLETYVKYDKPRSKQIFSELDPYGEENWEE